MIRPAYSNYNEGRLNTGKGVMDEAAARDVLLVKAIETTPGCDDPADAPYRVVKEKVRKKKTP